VGDRVIAALGRLGRRIRRDGIREALLALHTRYCEWRLGVHTNDWFTSQELGFATAEYQPYGPTDYRSFRQVMKHVPVSSGRDVFLDYGSGQGRVLLMAATYPFRRVLGVEMSPMLNQQAARNIEHCRHRLRCREIEVIQADATLFVPPGDVTVMYFFSPFGPHVLPAVLDRIQESLQAHPRGVTLLYRNPSYFEAEARSRPWLTKGAEYAGYSKHTYVIYHADPARVG
jgi:SAM-dependent methyltransferase